MFEWLNCNDCMQGFMEHEDTVLIWGHRKTSGIMCSAKARVQRENQYFLLRLGIYLLAHDK